MAMDLPKLRKLGALDPSDPLSRFAIGKRLFETATDNAMRKFEGRNSNDENSVAQPE